jgi:dTDP-4-amino-4,6-dideoxygalactose transaminase
MFSDQHAACPKAAELSRRVLSLPLHPQLSDNDVDRVIDAVRACIERTDSLASASA